jgi:TolB protein
MKRLLGVSLLLLPLWGLFADIDITISGAKVRKPRLAVSEIRPSGGAPDLALVQKIQSEIYSDLELINLFEVMPKGTYSAVDAASAPNLEEAKKLSLSFFLRLNYQVTAGKLALDATLYDVAGEKKVFATRYQFSSSLYYRLVHAMSEDILMNVSGERGLFFSRVLMVCNPAKKVKSPPKDIYVADADGRNLIQLTDDKTISVSPSWAPDGKSVSYTQYDWVYSGGIRKKGTVLKRHNLSTGRRNMLSSREGMNSGAAWKPDGSRIALTLSFTGRPELYLLDPLAPANPEPLSRNIQWQKVGGGFQATNVNLLFEVEPSWSPDGKQMVISSARSKHPMIYVVEMASKIARQLTFAGIYNASPAWSPKGDKIVFAAQRLEEGNFDLYLIDPDGNNLNRLTVGDRAGRRKVNSENPSWAPTGRHIAFSANEGGTYGVYVMTSDGLVVRKISPPNQQCMTPSWGPKEG